MNGIIMKFKEWMIDEINKGLARQFFSQSPNLPRYVAKQVLANRVNPLWQNVVAAHSPTIATIQPNSPNSDLKKPTHGSLSDLFGDSSVQSIAGNKNWSLKVVEIHPLNFTQDTIQAFLLHQFGASPSLTNKIKNHSQRMNTQNALAVERGQGENEPIVMVMDGDKYRMQEGWHRLYSYLLQFSAPPEELQKIQSGDSKSINLTIWKPIKIKAYIGS